MTKVIYMGFPMLLDETKNPTVISGFWSFIPMIWFNGGFMVYEGSYFKALWYWFTNAGS